MSSEGSRGPAIISDCGDAEMCAVGLVEFFVFRGPFAVLARRAGWRLPVFFVAAGVSDSGEA